MRRISGSARPDLVLPNGLHVEVKAGRDAQGSPVISQLVLWFPDGKIPDGGIGARMSDANTKLALMNTICEYCGQQIHSYSVSDHANEISLTHLLQKLSDEQRTSIITFPVYQTDAQNNHVAIWMDDDPASGDWSCGRCLRAIEKGETTYQARFGIKDNDRWFWCEDCADVKNPTAYDETSINRILILAHEVFFKSSLEERLQHLAELVRQGLIMESEAEAKRLEILKEL